MRIHPSMGVLGVLAAGLLVITVTRADAARDWSVGSNLGLSALVVRNADNVTYLSLPGTVVSLQPGLRIGLRGASPHREVFFDTGLNVATASGFRSTSLGVTGNYQLNLGTGEGISPYVNGGLGFLYASHQVGDARAGATSATFGAGVGLRRMLPGGAGDLRGELRWDYVTKGEDGGVVLTPSGSGFGVRLGFDLWMHGGRGY